MRQESGMIGGDLELTSSLRLMGSCTGTIVVTDGGHLDLLGMCQELIVLKGGSAVVRGMVIGHLENQGGSVEVLGSVGMVSTTAGVTNIHPKAQIERELLTDDESDISSRQKGTWDPS